MNIVGLKSLVIAALTPSVDRIISQFEKTHARLMKAAAAQNARGHQLLQEMNRKRLAAGNAFAECERAERIAENLSKFIGK